MGSTMPCEFRVFQPEDHAQALGLWLACGSEPGKVADTYDSIARYLERNPGLSWVVVEGVAVVGTILCGHDGRRGLIHHMAVAATHRRRGLGKELVRRALAGLNRQGVDKCHLLVFHDNPEGRAFWQSVGADERTTLSLFSMGT